MNWPSNEYERQVQAAWLHFWASQLGRHRLHLPFDYSPLAIDATSETMWNAKLRVLAGSHETLEASRREVARHKSYIIAGVYDAAADLQDAAVIQFLKEHLMRDGKTP